jgi:hypothetical protein
LLDVPVEGAGGSVTSRPLSSTRGPRDNKYGGAMYVIDTALGQHCNLATQGQLDFNQTGPQGPSGPSGAGGPSGPSGPQGPGAAPFSSTLPADGITRPLLGLANGVGVFGSCSPAGVPFLLLQASGSNLQAFGTENEDFGTGLTTLPVEADGVSAFNTASTTATPVDMDVVARDKSVGPFFRLDLHLGSGNPCPFFGMIIPSS